MTSQEITRKYPRLTKVLMAIGEDTELANAVQIIGTAKHNKASFAHSLVTEAWKLRHQYKGTNYAPVELVGKTSHQMDAMAIW